MLLMHTINGRICLIGACLHLIKKQGELNENQIKQVELGIKALKEMTKVCDDYYKEQKKNER